MYYPDLPTTKRCQSGVFEKSPQKSGDWGPQTWRFLKQVSNKTKKGNCFCHMVFFTLLDTIYSKLLLLNVLGYLAAASCWFSFLQKLRFQSLRVSLRFCFSIHVDRMGSSHFKFANSRCMGMRLGLDPDFPPNLD